MAGCLIVGTTRGIGAELARQYAADGQRVIGTFRNSADGPRVAALCARALPADVLADGWATALGRALAGDCLLYTSPSPRD